MKAQMLICFYKVNVGRRVQELRGWVWGQIKSRQIKKEEKIWNDRENAY